jgi:uncharacterized protein
MVINKQNGFHEWPPAGSDWVPEPTTLPIRKLLVSKKMKKDAYLQNILPLASNHSHGNGRYLPIAACGSGAVYFAPHSREDNLFRLAQKFSGAFGITLILLFGTAAWGQQASTSNPKPKVRAITAFIRIDRERYKAQVGDALAMLLKVKAAFEHDKYEVQTIRVVTQPFREYVRGLGRADALAFLHGYDDFIAAESKRVGIAIPPNIGPAILATETPDDAAMADLLGEILSTTQLESSIIVAGEDGIHWNAVRAAAKVVKYAEEHSPHSQGTFNFAATAMLAPYAPYYPGAYHTGAGHQFAIGLESANVVDQVFGSTQDPKLAVQRLTETLTVHARVAERIGQEIQQQTGWAYLGFDPTPAPLKDVSIGAAIEKFTGARFGSSGTLTAASVITQAVKAVPVKQTGYAGLMLPVLEDSRLAQRWTEGSYNIDSLLAYSAVCGTGLDTIPLPGDVSEQQLARIIGDVAALAVKWHKSLTARLQPVMGRKTGEMSDFDDPFLVNAKLHPLP